MKHEENKLNERKKKLLCGLDFQDNLPKPLQEQCLKSHIDKKL